MDTAAIMEYLWSIYGVFMDYYGRIAECCGTITDYHSAVLGHRGMFFLVCTRVYTHEMRRANLQAHVRTHVDTHVCLHTCLNSSLHTCLNSSLHTCLHTGLYTHVYTHAYTHVYTNVHTHEKR